MSWSYHLHKVLDPQLIATLDLREKDEVPLRIFENNPISARITLLC